MPRVALMILDRRFAAPRWNDNARGPDLARSESEFFRGVFDPPLRKQASLDIHSQVRPSTAQGLARPPVDSSLRGVVNVDAWRQENLERSRLSFGKLVLDSAVMHPAAFLGILDNQARQSLSKVQSSPSRPSTSDPVRTSQEQSQGVRSQSPGHKSSICCSPQRLPAGGARKRDLHTPQREVQTKYRTPYPTAGHIAHPNTNPKPSSDGREEWAPVGGEKSAESEDSNVAHVLFHPQEPVVQVQHPHRHPHRSASHNSFVFVRSVFPNVLLSAQLEADSGLY